MMQIVEYFWMALGVYWLISARNVKGVQQSESGWKHWLRIALLLVLFEFVFASWGHFWYFGARFVAASGAVTVAGFVLLLGGIGLSAWARACLGANWSSAVMIKQQHTLVGSGPYRLVRHPIYTGMALSLAGTALVSGEARALLAFAALLAVHAVKARKEEAWLAREFGDSFRTHCRRTGRFLPRLRRARQGV